MSSDCLLSLGPSLSALNFVCVLVATSGSALVLAGLGCPLGRSERGAKPGGMAGGVEVVVVGEQF